MPPPKKTTLSTINGWGMATLDDFSIKDGPKVGKQPDPRSLKARHHELDRWEGCESNPK